jgi:hypothetical protein
MIAELLAAVVLGQASACAPPEGVDLLWQDAATRFVFVGETHGTSEAPAAFAELVCARSAVGPVIVALEMPAGMQPDLDIWFASDGGAEARDILLAHDYWNLNHADGRSSLAMLALLQRLHDLRTSGRDLTVRAYQPGDRRPPGFDQSYYELDMARLLIDAAALRPEATVLALGGSLHAMKTPSPRHGFLFAAGHINPAHVRSLIVAAQGGSTWACFGPTRADCGVRETGAAFDPALRGVILESQQDGAWDGLLALGPVTASPPAGRE